MRIGGRWSLALRNSLQEFEVGVWGVQLMSALAVTVDFAEMMAFGKAVAVAEEPGVS